MKKRTAPRRAPLRASSGAPDPETQVGVEHQYPSGRVATLRTTTAEELIVRAPDGAVELHIEFTPNGPKLRFTGASLELTGTDRIDIDCKQLKIRASEQMEVECRGSVAIRSDGDQLLESNAGIAVRGRRAELKATREDVVIHANDDVRVDGERVLLNS